MSDTTHTHERRRRRKPTAASRVLAALDRIIDAARDAEKAKRELEADAERQAERGGAE